MQRILLILLAAAAVYLAGNARVGLWDRDEPRYAQCSRQMLESGDWVVPRLYDKLRTQKPPLIYWCQATAMKLLGRQDGAGAFAARLPSVVAMLATLVLLSFALWRHSGAEQATWTVFVFATSALTIMSAKICLTDSVLTFFVIVAQLCLYAIWRGNRSWSVAIVLAIMFGVGGLTKGPFIVGIVAATAASLAALHGLDRWLEKRAARQNESAGIPSAASDESEEPKVPAPLDESAVNTASNHWPRTIAQVLVGAIIVTAIVLPWIVMVNHRAPEFMHRQLTEAGEHMSHGKEGHSYPPGYHLVMVWPMFMPWSLLLPLAIGLGIHNRKVPEIRFALAAVMGPWVMVELLGTKLPHYLLPAYPAMAFLVAFAIRRCLDGESREVQSTPFRIGAAVWALAIIAVGFTPWLAARSFSELPKGAMISLTVVCAIIAIAVYVQLLLCRFGPAFATMGGGILVLIALASTLYFPQAQFLRTSIHVAQILRLQGATYRNDVLMTDYKEPSLGFYQGGTIREQEKKADLLKKPIEQWPQWVVMTREVWNMASPAQRRQLQIIDSVKGLAYADQGRMVEVMVVHNRLAETKSAKSEE